jgi:eukaryotic-like serine/threonine-protein kinase
MVERVNYVGRRVGNYRLVHPNIVRVLDFGVEDEVPYLAMDYAANGTLRQRHPKGSRLPVAAVVAYVKQVAQALQHAHDQRPVHRDVKPENMLLGRFNEVLLSDFGIALAAQSSQYQSTQNVAGTIGYMAPEQIQAHPRPASDQYSLGVVVYEWLSGERPFQGSFTEIAVKHAMVMPAPLQNQVPYVTPAIEEVVMIALAKDPYKRFANVRAFAQALEQASTRGISPQAELLASTYFAPQPPGPFNASAVDTSTRRQSANPGFAQASVPSNVMPYMPAPSNTSGLHGVPPPVTGQGPMQWTPGSGQLYGNDARGAQGMNGMQPGAGQFGPYGGFASGQEMYYNGMPRPYGNDIRSGNERKRLSRRSVVAGVVGLVAASSGLTWFVVSRQQALLAHIAQASHSATYNLPGSGTPYTYPTPTDAVPPQLTYKGQQGYIWSVAWSPNGAYIVSGSDDGTAHIWHSDTGARVLSYRSRITPARDNDWAKKVAWSPDSKRIAIGFMDGTTQGADINSGQELFNYSHALSSINALAWSPDGRYIVTGDFDGTAVVYEVASGRAVTTYTGHTDGILALAWSPDSKRIASGSSDASARIWDALSGNTQLIYKNHKSDVQAVSWSHDGSRIVSSGLDGTAQVWQANGGYTLLTYTKHTGGEVMAVAWSHNDTYIASGGNDVNTHVWEAKTGTISKMFYTFPIFGLAWSPDDKHLVTGGYNKVSQVWGVS